MNRAAWILSGLFLVGSAGAVAHVRGQAQAAKAEAEALAAVRAEEARALAVLRSEIADLENPARLKALARTHLGLEPIDPDDRLALEEALAAARGERPATLQDPPE